MQTLPNIILASRSPRRLELLRQIGVEPKVLPADINETVLPGESAEKYVLRMAQEKARAIPVSTPDSIVIGSDTTVVKSGDIFGKPRDFADAHAMLSALSGAAHQVLSAVAVVKGDALHSRTSSTEVEFRALTEAEIAQYWDTGEPLGKAGSYAIQGLGATFISAIRGSYSGVMGLPLYETAALLQLLGLPVLGSSGRNGLSKTE